jgi:hypothetical protein
MLLVSQFLIFNIMIQHPRSSIEHRPSGVEDDPAREHPSASTLQLTRILRLAPLMSGKTRIQTGEALR